MKGTALQEPMQQQTSDGSFHCPDQSCGLDDGSPAAAGPLIIPSDNLLERVYLMGAPQFDRAEIFWHSEFCWKEKTDQIIVMFSQMLFDSVIFLQILSRGHSRDTSHGTVTCGLGTFGHHSRVFTGLPSPACV